MVDRAVAAAGVLYTQLVPLSLILIMSCHKTYDKDQAPPAMHFLHDLQVQIPTESRFTESLPQKLHANRLVSWRPVI